MPVYSSLQNSPQAGGLYRKKLEQRSKLEAIPEGKGAIGTMTRNLVEEPIERPVAPGAKKVVGVKPSVVPTEDRGILPQNASSPEQVAGPAAMGMIMPSRITPRASSNKAGTPTPSRGAGGAVGTPAGVSLKPKTVSKGSTAVALPSNVLGPQAPSQQNKISSSYIAGPKDTSKRVEGKKNASEQEIRAATTKFTPAVAKESAKKFISNPKVEAPKALRGITERIKETVTNATKGKGTYQKKILGFLRSLFS